MALTTQQRDRLFTILYEEAATRPGIDFARELYNLNFATNSERLARLRQLLIGRRDRKTAEVDAYDAAAAAAKDRMLAERDELIALYNAI